MAEQRIDSTRATRLVIQVIGSHECIRDARVAGVQVIRVRDEVVTICMPYAYRLAHQLVKLPGVSRIDSQDIEGAALLGLVEGVDSFQPRKGVQIQTHLWNRIRKRVNEERVMGHWAIMRPPRSQVDRYMSGDMNKAEIEHYLDTFVRPHASNMTGDDGMNQGTGDRLTGLTRYGVID